MVVGRACILSMFSVPSSAVHLTSLPLKTTLTPPPSPFASLSRRVQYLAGVSVAAGTVDGPNPLLVINSRTSIAVPLPVRMGHVPVVEGNHMVGTGRAHAGRR